MRSAWWSAATVLILAPGQAGRRRSRQPGRVGIIPAFHQLLAVPADCFTRAIVRAALSSTSATTPAGGSPAYLDMFGSADRR